MKEKLQALVEQAMLSIRDAQTTQTLDALETQVLGRKGELTGLLRMMGGLSAEEKPIMGQLLNEAKANVQDALNLRKEALMRLEKSAKLEAEQIDITLPSRIQRIGHKHPVSYTQETVKSALIGLGFEFMDAPELEDYQYNFAALNYPENHPAMDEQMSFYVTDRHLLRTQTTALQGRTLTLKKPPFRYAITGRCFRNETVDATHHHTFHQVDVFMVDKGVSMADLKGTLAAFARRMFGPDVQVRFRPDFFPFVEPGVDYSISWKGGWLELGGAGLIHPNILRAHGIDPNEWSGFAFGLGIERIPMIQRGVDDLRLFLENDLRFLNQFGA